MSTVLESAIADATKLREMALKHAEKTLVEKYRSNIDSAVQYILEQEDMEEVPEEKDPKLDEDKTHVVELNDQLKEQDGQGFAFMEETSKEVSSEEVELSFESILSEVKRMEEAGVYNLDEKEVYEVDESDLSEMLDSENSEDKNKNEEDKEREKACLKMKNTNNIIARSCKVFVKKFCELADGSENLKEFDDKAHALMILSTIILKGMKIFKKVPEQFDPGEHGITSLETIHEV